MIKAPAFLLLALAITAASAREYHVAITGNDTAHGTSQEPLRTISTAADRAQPGDTITVHGGTYRERINPPRGGQSTHKRIVYQAAPGESVIIKGSEIIKGWTRMQNDTWKTTIPNQFFGQFNPYNDLIRGDWFWSRGRQLHTGAVYLDNHWLTEAANLEDVLKPIGAVPPPNPGGFLLNIAWVRPIHDSEQLDKVPASAFSAQSGVGTSSCSEGGKCIGWIEYGDWVRYDHINFGTQTDKIEFRAASLTQGGIIEIRLDAPDGQILGTCRIPNTGGWQTWSSFIARIKPTSGSKTICLTFKSTIDPPQEHKLWFARVDDANTTIWAQFRNVDPNIAEVEINVRQSVFYPDKSGINYITVRGFTMMHAATPWAPPTAEQIGLIGTHWSKGWIIENNDIRYSTCTGITLGKYGDQWDNKSQNSAEGYIKTIERALANGWSEDNIGHHIVRDNHIAHCEQAGIVGSMGAAFCTVANNEIHHIHIRRLFNGAEMAAIKFHAAIDTEISHNHIHHANRGIWLDWMSQGTRVTRNLLHHNGPNEDLFLEVNHGPLLVDHNILLSPTALFDMSQGAAFAHNLFAGRIVTSPETSRQTPYHYPHSTKVAGLHNIPGGDNRFYNNIFIGCNGLQSYDKTTLPSVMNGNVFLKGASPAAIEARPLDVPDYDPNLVLEVKDEQCHLNVTLDKTWANSQKRETVNTRLLGKAKIPNLPYTKPDNSPYLLEKDFFGKKRPSTNPFPGPFEIPTGGRQTLRIWPTPAESSQGC